MTRLTAPVLLVGSVPGEGPREVMELCSKELGQQLDLYPDGETGVRGEFIQGLALASLYGHPDLEVAQRPARSWRPEGYHDLWKFRVRAGTQSLQLGRLPYATEAIRSYAEFRALKAEGMIPEAARFLIAFPLVDTACAVLAQTYADYRLLFPAMERAIKLELELIFDSLPAHELAIQWDCPIETIAVSTANSETKPFAAWLYNEPQLPKFASVLERMCEAIPGQAVLGLHLCYGNLGHRHIVEPEDLSAVTAMANVAAERLDRRIDFVHVPVPIERHDDAYFAPLDDWRAGSSRLYLGLIHERDSLGDNIRRIAAAQVHMTDFGISTECGLKRCAPAVIPELLALHRELAEKIKSG